MNCFCLDFLTTVTVILICFAICMSGIIYARLGVGNTIVIMFSLGDLLSDILYVSVEAFWHPTLQWLCLAFALMPLVGLLYFYPPTIEFLRLPIDKMGFVPWPGMWLRWPCMAGRVDPKTGSNSADDELLMVGCNALYTLLRWLLFVVLNIFYVLFVFIGWPLSVLIMTFVGFVLFATKLLSIRFINARFLHVWRYTEEAQKGKELDHAVFLADFNKMLVTELVSESIPQVFLQLINNRENYGPVAIISMIYSLLVIFSHAWRFLRHVRRGTSWLDVPTLNRLASFRLKGDTSSRSAVDLSSVEVIPEKHRNPSMLHISKVNEEEELDVPSKVNVDMEDPSSRFDASVSRAAAVKSPDSVVRDEKDVEELGVSHGAVDPDEIEMDSM